MPNLRPIVMLSMTVIYFVCPELFASSSGMPWEDPLDQITESLTGPVARSVGLIALAMTGITLAMGEAWRIISSLGAGGVWTVHCIFSRYLGNVSFWHRFWSVAMKKELDPEGFRIPIHRSLTESLMMAGVPRNIAIGNGIAVVSFVLGAHNLWILPIGILSHLVLVALHRYDKDILQILKRNLAKAPFLRS